MTPEQQAEFDRLFRLKYTPVLATNLKRRKICPPGSRWGRLVVLADIPGVPKIGIPRRHVFTLCDCGTLSDKIAFELVHHRTQSCGCIRVEAGQERIKAAMAARWK